MGEPLISSLGRVSDRSFYVAASLISTGALALIGYTLMIRGGSEAGTLDLRFMPAVNAGLNATAAHEAKIERSRRAADDDRGRPGPGTDHGRAAGYHDPARGRSSDPHRNQTQCRSGTNAHCDPPRRR